MISWFDIAYAVLDFTIISYCVMSYVSSRKKPFLLCGLGFTCLIISEFVWVFAVFPGPNGILGVYSYIRLGLYTAFILLVIRTLQLLTTHQN
ncbi:MAG: hypothetical protein OEZ29_02130 [Candidatus Bathyarchaeota archaeon]|nr:hypothetical protein [Candidatus Bathyarchaeota archaeon]MDH5779376.1 hypothetical protein [Candidatus Bathyarchaeota archaeon]